MIAREWRESGWLYEPYFEKEVMSAIARISTHSTSYRFAWRGLASADFTMTSSLHRLLVEEGERVTETALFSREQSILDEARRWGLGVEGGQPVDDLQLLADLQHFGVPTRLIDVTSNPMTALWFATAPASNEDRHVAKSGLLVGIDMSWYREATDGRKPQTVFKTVGPPPASVAELGQGTSRQRRMGLALATPFVVSSSIPNHRLRAQEGYFLASAHPDHSGPMESLKIDAPQGDLEVLRETLTTESGRGFPRRLPFVAILVPARTKAKLRTYLKRTYSRTAKHLFPDFAGFKEYGGWR